MYFTIGILYSTCVVGVHSCGQEGSRSAGLTLSPTHLRTRERNCSGDIHSTHRIHTRVLDTPLGFHFEIYTFSYVKTS